MSIGFFAHNINLKEIWKNKFNKNTAHICKQVHVKQNLDLPS